MKTEWRAIAAAIAASIATTVVLNSTWVRADGDPGTDGVPRYIPYKGTLEKDGVAWDGPIDMVFRLYDGPDTATPAWEETQVVTVYAGRFSVLLGSTSAASVDGLSTALAAADDVYLAVGVKPENGAEIPLSNRQRFLPVPFAHWSTRSTSFQVASQLLVESNKYVPSNGSTGAVIVRDSQSKQLLVDGDDLDSTASLKLNAYSKQTVQTGGDLTVNGDSVAFGSSGSGAGGVALKHVASNRLTVNPGGALGSYTKIDSPLEVNGALAVKAGLSTTGAITIGGATTLNNTLLVAQSSDFEAAVNFQSDVYGLTATVTLDNCDTTSVVSQGSSPGWWYCDGSKVLRGLKLSDHSNVGGDGTLIYEYQCCDIVVTVK